MPGVVCAWLGSLSLFAPFFLSSSCPPCYTVILLCSYPAYHHYDCCGGEGKLLTKTCLLIIIIKQFGLECVIVRCCSMLQQVAVASAITAPPPPPAPPPPGITGISCSLLQQFLNVNYALCWLSWPEAASFEAFLLFQPVFAANLSVAAIGIVNHIPGKVRDLLHTALHFPTLSYKPLHRSLSVCGIQFAI